MKSDDLERHKFHLYIELTINDVLRSFSRKGDDSSDDDNADQFDEIHDYILEKSYLFDLEQLNYSALIPEY